MIYHVSFGDILVGTRKALALRSRLEDSQPVFLRARVMRNVADALRYAGEESSARALMCTAYQLAAEHSNADAARVAADKLVRMAIDQGQLAQAEQWLALLRKWPSNGDDAISEAAYAETRARVALEAGFISEAVEIFRARATLSTGEWDVRSRRTDVAIRTALLLASSPAQIPADVVDELLWVHSRASNATAHDALVASLFSALVRNGEEQKAHSILSAYLMSQRRGDSSLSAELTRILDEHSTPSASNNDEESGAAPALRSRRGDRAL
jgi:hypothetical protein